MTTSQLETNAYQKHFFVELRITFPMKMQKDAIFSTTLSYDHSYTFYCSGRCGTKPVRLLMDQRTGRFLGALNQNELMGPPTKDDMSKKASPTSLRGMAQQKPRMLRPMRLWPGERPLIASPSMPSNINQVSKYYVLWYNRSIHSYI